MEKFKEFEIENQDLIFGGINTSPIAGTEDTTWVDGNGNRGLDKYDKDLDRVIYL